VTAVAAQRRLRAERGRLTPMIELRSLTAFVLALTIGGGAHGEAITFGPDLAASGWSVVTFPGVAPAGFKASGASAIEVTADAAAGLLWRAVKEQQPPITRAQWSWQVEEGVPPTDLTRRGKDDRALAVYFIFGASTDRAKGAMALLSSRSVRTLVYVFGGDRPRGSVLPSPHMGERGKFIILRPADAPRRQWVNENVDLTSDHVRAFGQKPSHLLAVAVSSDSDDTRGRNRVRLRDLRMGD
jgi:hypothetical protein